MRRTFLIISFLALVLLVVLIASASLGMAQTNQPVENARPTPTPIAPPPGRAPAAPEGPTSPEIPPLPDLIVEKIEVVPSVPIKDKAATIRVTIKNQGSVDVPLYPQPNNFWSDLYIDPSEVPIQLGQNGVYAWGCQASWVPAGGFYVLETTYVFTDVKTYNLWAQVDTDNHVQEANENNNLRGPVAVEVRSEDTAMHQTHQDFQLGMASSLDLSHPDGVMRLGIFDQPWKEPYIYTPDIQIDSPGPPSGPTYVNQTRPAMASNAGNPIALATPILFAVWEDGRNGGVYNRDIWFARSIDGGDWEELDEPVNDYLGTANQIRPDLVYDPDRGTYGRLYAVWQDEQAGNYDIYFAYSDDAGNPAEPILSVDWTVHSTPLNDDTDSAGQLNPSIALGPNGIVYVVWEDQRNGNGDIYLARSRNGGATWSPNYFVTDDPDMRTQNQSAPSVAVENVRGRVVVAWEDWRSPQHPEIYAMWSEDEGETWGIDVPVTIPGGGSYRRAPTVATQTTTETLEYWDEIEEITKTTTTGVTVIHVAWEEGPPDQTDIYYSYSYYTFDAEAREECPYPYEAAFCFQAPQKMNGTVIDSDYVRPPDGGPTWPIEPSWQGQVSIGLVPEGSHWTGCHAGSTQVYSRGVVLAWSDARSYDDWRYEIHTRRVASPEGTPTTFEPCEDWMWGMVNSYSKLYALRDDPAKYEIYQPAATGQFNPEVLVEPANVFVAWDDDRYDDPTISGTVRNRDVFMQRMALGSVITGTFLSPVIDGKMADPQWYVLSWWGVTELGGNLLFQTRFGITSTLPKDPDVPFAESGWTAWTGNPSSNAYIGPECLTGRGEGCYYDAPGRRIVDPDGDDWFNCSGTTCPGPYRYMQYKLVLRGDSRRTAVSRVVVHYRGQGLKVYLPVVLRNY